MLRDRLKLNADLVELPLEYCCQSTEGFQSVRLRFARRAARVTLLLSCSAALFSSFGCIRPSVPLKSGGVAGQLRVLHARDGERDLGAAVVYLDNGPRPGPDRSQHPATLVFGEDGSIHPSLLAVGVGQRIFLELQVRLLHQPFTYSLSGSPDVPADGAGDLSLQGDDSRELIVGRPGVVRIYCSLHRNERAVIYVSPSPYFSVIDSRGRYGIDDVPAGAYRLVLWSDVVEGTVRSIQVEGGTPLVSNIWIDARKIPR